MNYIDILNNSSSVEYMLVVEDILGYKLSQKDKQPFLFFHDFITNPKPLFLNEWQENEKRQKWSEKFSNRIIGDVQNAFPCVLYHYERITILENKLLEELNKRDFRKHLPKNSTIGGGNTLVFDFEYQAYILAFRRCLDYLARAMGTYFLQDFNSFRKLGEQLKKLNKPEVTKELIKTHENFLTKFKFVVSKGNEKSVRDIISHYEFVSAGTVNINSNGIILISGGKETTFYGGKDKLFSEYLSEQVSDLRLCIRNFIHVYVETIKKDQFTKRK